MSTAETSTKFHWGTGRRKTAVARVRLREVEAGKILVNKKALEDYFPDVRYINAVLAPIITAGLQGKIECFVNVRGGGPTGQAGAVLLGVARALLSMNPEIEHDLRVAGFLTRDGRMVERKKYGHKKARKSFQFSKR